MADTLSETIESVQRIQTFDAAQLSRRDALGAAFSFEQAVGPAEDMVGLLRQISLSNLRYLPHENLRQIKMRQIQCMIYF